MYRTYRNISNDENFPIYGSVLTERAWALGKNWGWALSHLYI